jgi:exodeoxyribonuclease X
MTAIVFDTETTGVKNPGLVEAAWIELESPRDQAGRSRYCERFNPGKPIDLGAMATHHIMDEDLAECRPSSEFALPEGTQYLIGHNIDFDWRVIGQPPVKRICTLALARRAWPDLDTHTQSALMYHLDRPNARDKLRAAHSANADVEMCMHIFGTVMAIFGRPDNWDAAWQISEAARAPKKMPFGKHKGLPLTDLPRDYVGWLLRQEGTDPYLVAALRAV